MQMDEYRAWFDEMHAAFPRVKNWMMGMRNEISSKHHTLTGLLWTEGKLLQAPIMDIPDVIDPVGVGDAFAAALKNTIPGDFNLSTEDEILDVMEQRHNQDTLYKTYQ